MWLGAFGSAWRTLTAAVAEQLTCLLAGEAPLDRAPLAIGPALPGGGLAPEHRQVWDVAPADALADQQADGDFRLVQPAGVLGRVVDAQPVPQAAAQFLAISVGQRRAGMDVQVV